MSPQQVPIRPVVSIILATFNRLKYLRVAVDSVLTQTFRDWELIVADDGSDLETRTYLATLEVPPRSRVLWRSHSGVPAAVRNAALREAAGTYVAFLDSDDLWVPQKLEKQLEALRARPHCRWSYSAFTQVDGQGAVLADESRRKWVPHDGAVFAKLLKNEATFRTPSVVVADRQLVMQLGGFDEQLRSAEDFDLYLRLALHSEVALVDEPLVYVRVHEDNYSSKDEPSGLAGRGCALEKLQGVVDLRWRALVRKERAKTALGLANAYALMNTPVNVLRTIWNSLPYSWRYPEWWRGAPKAMLRSCLPRSLLELRRRRRADAQGHAARIRRQPE